MSAPKSPLNDPVFWVLIAAVFVAAFAVVATS
jgi:hypothetical protein